MENCHPRGSWKSPWSWPAAWRGGRSQYPRVDVAWGLPWGEWGCIFPLSPSHLLFPNGQAVELTGLIPLPISQQDLWACSWREQAVRGSLDGLGRFLAFPFFLFFFLFVCLVELFICLVLMFFLFPAGPLPGSRQGMGGVVESKDLCAPLPCCGMQTCACSASLAEDLFYFFKKAPELPFYFFRNM